jgi:hypothetical protein
MENDQLSVGIGVNATNLTDRVHVWRWTDWLQEHDLLSVVAIEHVVLQE